MDHASEDLGGSGQISDRTTEGLALARLARRVESDRDHLWPRLVGHEVVCEVKQQRREHLGGEELVAGLRGDAGGGGGGGDGGGGGGGGLRRGGGEGVLSRPRERMLVTVPHSWAGPAFEHLRVCAGQCWAVLGSAGQCWAVLGTRRRLQEWEEVARGGARRGGEAAGGRGGRGAAGVCVCGGGAEQPRVLGKVLWACRPRCANTGRQRREGGNLWAASGRSQGAVQGCSSGAVRRGQKR